MKEGGLKLTLLVAASVLASSASWAQTNEDANAGIQFNFSLPGARSLALGGAFLALADDATAAYTNPAGLTVLAKPEVSVEGRAFDYTHQFTDRGHAFGSPTGQGVDTVPGLVDGEASNDTSDLSFASFVYPKGSWAVAVYHASVANFEASYQSNGPFFDITEPFPCVPSGQRCLRVTPYTSQLDLEIAGTGASFALRFGSGFSIGVGVAQYDFELDSLTQRFQPAIFFGPADFSPSRQINFQQQLGDDDDVGVTAGFVWRGDKFNIGGVYRQGAEFEMIGRNTSGVLAGTPVFTFEKPAQFNLPDVYGVGIAFRPTPALTVALDWDRVEYSALSENVVDLFTVPGGDPDPTVQDLRIDDADEIHVGLEYQFVDLKFPLSLRIGGWLDPDHRLTYVGPTNTANERVNAVLFREGEDDEHITGGFGIVFGSHFQLDVGYDQGDRVETGSVSGVFRF